jgi:hypothetical protein
MMYSAPQSLRDVRSKLEAIDFNYFASIVITAISTDPMGHFLLPTVGARVKGGEMQFPIGTAFTCAGI